MRCCRKKKRKKLIMHLFYYNNVNIIVLRFYGKVLITNEFIKRVYIIKYITQ